MSTPPPTGSALTREAILRALGSLSDELGKQGVTGGFSEVPDIVTQYYPIGRIPVKTQYLVEGLFEEGKV